jgi:hypothetical protein
MEPDLVRETPIRVGKSSMLSLADTVKVIVDILVCCQLVQDPQLAEDSHVLIKTYIFADTCQSAGEGKVTTFQDTGLLVQSWMTVTIN